MSSIKQQADAVERAAMNLRGTIAHMKNMARVNGGDQTMIRMRESHLTDLLSAHKTMVWLMENEEKIRAALGRPKSVSSTRD